MDFLPTLILFLLTFTVIIAVHEFGYYLTARLLGMKVLEFAFGFPPRIAAIRHAGIDYSLNAIPFGGFVRIDQVAPGSPAESAGIQVGDIVRAIDGREIKRSGDLVSYVTSQARLHPDQQVTLQLERNGGPLPPITAVPRQEPPEGEGPLGIRLEEVQGAVAVSPPEAFKQALSLSGQVIGQIAELPGQLLAPRTSTGAPTVGGPIEIFRVTGQVAQFGIPTFLKLVGVLSVNLAVLNIVPFPGLDGGRLFFVLVAGIFRKRLSPQVEAAVHAVGFLLLLLLLVVVSINDIRRVVGG